MIMQACSVESVRCHGHLLDGAIRQDNRRRAGGSLCMRGYTKKETLQVKVQETSRYRFVVDEVK